MSKAYLFLNYDGTIEDFLRRAEKINQKKILLQIGKHNCNLSTNWGAKLTLLNEEKRQQLDTQLVNAAKTSHIYGNGQIIPASEISNIVLAEARQPFNLYVADILREIIHDVQMKSGEELSGIILYKSTKGTYVDTSLLLVHKKFKKNKLKK